MTAATSWTVTSGTKTTDDFYATVPACRRDDYMQFYADKTYLYDDGATKCRSIDLQSSKSTWYFGPNDTTLYFGMASGTDTWQIAQLTTTTLQIARQYKATNGTADTYGEDVTYTAF